MDLQLLDDIAPRLAVEYRLDESVIRSLLDRCGDEAVARLRLKLSADTGFSPFTSLFDRLEAVYREGFRNGQASRPSTGHGAQPRRDRLCDRVAAALDRVSALVDTFGSPSLARPMTEVTEPGNVERLLPQAFSRLAMLALLHVIERLAEELPRNDRGQQVGQLAELARRAMEAEW